jgi:hypothetical protein
MCAACGLLEALAAYHNKQPKGLKNENFICELIFFLTVARPQEFFLVKCEYSLLLIKVLIFSFSTPTNYQFPQQTAFCYK